MLAAAAAAAAAAAIAAAAAAADVLPQPGPDGHGARLDAAFPCAMRVCYVTAAADHTATGRRTAAGGHI